MKMKLGFPILLGIFLGISPIMGQIRLKPHAGLLFPGMGDVNAKIENDIISFRQITGEPIPSPGTIGRNKFFGVQVEYQIEEDYFASLNVGYYSDAAEVDYSATAGLRFHYLREVQLFDFMLNLHYYFNYSTWKRVNTYLGMGVGLSVANARSETFSNFGDELAQVDSRGDFAGNSLSALLGAGVDVRLSQAFSLWGELGLQYGNMGQLDGSVTTKDHPEKRDTVSQSSFDFTGIYVRAGLGVLLPFLK
ncbi:MAG: hypothetical protein D6681_11255 [Calditrichaeota bacterium]|nr:MAG: hypothetical protein D6681_11255 [Calditrichota bacterium]